MGQVMDTEHMGRLPQIRLVLLPLLPLCPSSCSHMPACWSCWWVGSVLGWAPYSQGCHIAVSCLPEHVTRLSTKISTEWRWSISISRWPLISYSLLPLAVHPTLSKPPSSASAWRWTFLLGPLWARWTYIFSGLQAGLFLVVVQIQPLI